jgi:hypothetical protein
MTSGVNGAKTRGNNMTTACKLFTNLGGLSLILICARASLSTSEALEKMIGVESTANLTISRPKRR